ncbi:MAG: DUF21 domain-containing protein [Kiritimatiellae bacterium]|nr:DUF21 domain-containing protein [Kiritimatiellia bacterium]
MSDASLKLTLCVAGIVFCILWAAFFSAMETGLTRLNLPRLMYWVKLGHKQSKRVEEYVSDLQRSLATTLIGTNLLNVILSTITAYISITYLKDSARGQMGLAFGVSCAMIYLGEYMPKLIFTSRPLRLTVALAPVFGIFSTLFAPVASFSLFLTRWFMPPSVRNSNNRFLISFDYLQDILNEKQPGANVTAKERLMIQSVFALRTKTAADVMVALNHAIKTTINATIGDCYDLARDSGHTRIPVLTADYQRCLGVVNVMRELAAGTDPETPLENHTLEEAKYVWDNELADRIMPLMRALHSPILLVRDAQTQHLAGVISDAMMLQFITSNKV